MFTLTNLWCKRTTAPLFYTYSYYIIMIVITYLLFVITLHVYILEGLVSILLPVISFILSVAVCSSVLGFLNNPLSGGGDVLILVV